MGDPEGKNDQTIFYRILKEVIKMLEQKGKNVFQLRKKFDKY